MFKKIMSVIGALSVSSALALVGAAPATAHVPAYSVDCSGLEVNLTNYAEIIPGVLAIPGTPGQEYIAPTYETQPNPDYVPEWVSYVEHDAVTHTEYEFEGPNGRTKWQTDPNWNAEVNEESVGWVATGATRVVVDVEGYTEAIDMPAVGEPTIEVMTDPGQEAIEPTEAIEAIPSQVNTVLVIIDGVTVEDAAFGTSFTGEYSFGDSTVEHSWSLTVTAHDDPEEYNFHIAAESVPCEAPVEGIECVPSGIWYTEDDDKAPTSDYSGLTFTSDGDRRAVGYRSPVSGNLQGFTGATYSATGDTHLFYYRIVVDTSADGGASYSSLTVTSGSPVTGDSVAYSNKVGASKTLNEWAAYFPNNVITSVGLHLDSGAPAGTEVVVTSLSGDCGSYSPPVPPVVIEGTPEAPVIVDECGVANDTVTLPEDTEEYSYILDYEGGAGSVTAIASDGHVFPEGVVTEWPFEFTDEACPVVIEPPVVVVPPVVDPPVVTPVVPAADTDTLAYTGSSPLNVPIIGGAAILVLLAGLAIFAFSRRNSPDGE